MFKADIRLRTLEMDEHLGIECNMSVEHADLGDKMMLMHTLAKGLQMNFLDIVMFALSEKAGAFESEGDIEIRVPKQPMEGNDEG